MVTHHELRISISLELQSHRRTSFPSSSAALTCNREAVKHKMLAEGFTQVLAENQLHAHLGCSSMLQTTQGQSVRTRALVTTPDHTWLVMAVADLVMTAVAAATPVRVHLFSALDLLLLLFVGRSAQLLEGIKNACQVNSPFWYI